MAAFARTELDLAALARKDDQAAVQLFVVRNGKMLGRDVFFLDAHHDVGDDEVLGSFLEQYYARATSVPREVLVPRSLADTADLEAFLTERRGSGVRLRTPAARREAGADGARDPQRRRGARARGRPLARRRGPDARARSRSSRRRSGWPGRRCASSATTSRTSRARQSVGSMVVFEEGRPRTGEYRRFRIRTVEGANDFASHQEVLRRRFRRGDERRGGPSRRSCRWAMPDLVIVDGGRGQVSAAKEVLDELGPARPAAGGPGQGARGAGPARTAPEPVLLPVTSQALYLVQRLRDEAHRFAITYHRNLRAKRATQLGVRRPAGRRARSAGASCSRCSARRSASARRRSSRSPPCRASAGRSRRRSRPTSRPDGPATVRDVAGSCRSPRAWNEPSGRRARTAAPVSSRPDATRRPDPDHRHRRARAPGGLRASPHPVTDGQDAGTTPLPRDQARTRPAGAACGSSTRCCRPRARRRRATTSASCARSSSTASTSRASPSPRSSSRATTGSSSRCRASRTRTRSGTSSGTTGRLDFVPLGQTPAGAGPGADPAYLAQRVRRRAPGQLRAVLRRPGRRGVDRRQPDGPADGRLHAPTATARTCSPTTPRTTSGDYFAIVLDGKVITRARDQQRDPRRPGPDRARTAASAATRWPRRRTSSRSCSSASCRSRSRSSPTRPSARRSARRSCTRACIAGADRDPDGRSSSWSSTTGCRAWSPAAR